MKIERKLRTAALAAIALFVGATLATADETPPADHGRATVDCAWTGLAEVERRYMVLGGGREKSNTEIVVLLPGLPPSLDVPALATSCGVGSEGVLPLAVGLQWRSREEAAREAIVKVGRDPAVVDHALRHLFAKHRRDMGDALSCPGETEIERDWDRSVANAISRTRNRTIVRSAYALTALAVFARTGQEGAERHIRGQAPACPS